MTVIAAILFIGLPGLGTVAAWISAGVAWRRARQGANLGAGSMAPKGMLLTLLLLPTVPIIYGFVLLFLALQPTARSIPLELMEVAAISYAIPGLLTGVGMAMIYRRGAAAVAVRKELFGRILTAGVLPHTAALFGLITGFLILGGLLIWADSIPAVGFATQHSIVSRAAFYISLGALGAPLSAFLFTFKWDFATEEAWGRALALATLGEVVSIAGLVFAMSVLLGS